MTPEGFRYIPDFLTCQEHDGLLDQLRSLPFEHDVFRGQRLKRGWAQFGYQYFSTGRRLIAAAPLPGFARQLAVAVVRYCPFGEAAFDQCIVTHYPRGAGIGWHVDAPQFGDVIAGVSLSGEARMQFVEMGNKELQGEITLAPGSLYVMAGRARWNWRHRVLPVARERYSVTFRSVPTRDMAGG